jgi:hypothetical protein
MKQAQTYWGVFGNVARDHIPLNPNAALKFLKYLKSFGIELERGSKNQISELQKINKKIDLNNILNWLLESQPLLRRTGGGGKTSYSALKKIAPEERMQYFDLMNCPEPFFSNLSKYRFGNLAPAPNAIIIDLNGERTILSEDRPDIGLALLGNNLDSLESLLLNCNALLVNSVANKDLVDAIIEHSQKSQKYVVLTKNMVKVGIHKTDLLRNATVTLDIDEASSLGLKNTHTNSSYREAAKALLDLGAKRAIITSGKDGVIYTEKTYPTITRLSTSPKDECLIQQHVKHYGIGKTGGGDTFKAKLSHSLQAGKSLEDAVFDAQEYIIRNFLRYPVKSLNYRKENLR